MNRTLRRPFIAWNVFNESPINRYDYQRRLLQSEFEIENEVEELTAKLLDEGQLGTRAHSSMQNSARHCLYFYRLSCQLGVSRRRT